MKYIWNNNEYTQEDIDAALGATGQDLDTYLSENKIEVLEDENEKKPVDVTESADVASEAPAQENTVSEQESISLELPEEIKPVEIAQTDIEVEETEDSEEVEVEETDPPISILERLRRKKLQKEQAKQKALGIIDDVDFDLTYNDMQKNNRKVKKIMQDNGLTNVITVDQIPEEEKENYAKWNEENKVEIPNSEIIGYATKEFVEEGFKVDYKSPNVLSFLDPEKQAELDKLEGERLDQAKFVKLQETTDGLNEEVQQLQQSLENLNEGDLDYKKVINQINEINKQINSNNEELTQQFAYPDYEEGEMRFDKITPIYRTLDGRIYTSKDAGFYDVPLPEARIDSDQPDGTISISQEVEDQAIEDQTFTYNSRIKNALTTGVDEIIIPNAEKIKLDDVRKPEQLIENIFNDPQLSYDFLNVSNVPVNLKQNTSAKLFNETFEAYGFVAIENSDDKSIDIYYRPEYNPIRDKDGNLIEQGVGFMDVYTQQASVKDGQTPIASYSVNTEEYSEGSRQPGILGLRGPFARKSIAGDGYDSIMYLDDAQEDLGNSYKSSQVVKDAMLKSIQDHKNTSGYDQAYINTDSLDSGLTPSPALVMATEEQTKGYMDSIISNSKVIESVRSKIEKDYGQIEKDSKPLKEINDAVSSLSEDQEYIETNNNLKELNKSITKQNDRFVEINTILKEADPDGDGQVDAETFERIKPLIEEQKKISENVKQLQDQAKPMINLINKKLKPYEKSNKNFEKAWKRKGFESGEEYRVDLQTRFNDVDTRLNEDYKTLIEQSFLQEDFLEDANSSLMRSTATFMDWAEHTGGRGDFLKYTVNRAKNGVKDIMKGGVGTVFDLMNAANRLASDDPESANKYWEGAKKRARDIADENFRKTWADPDIDDFYIKDFESTMPGQAYGVFVDMMVDMGFGFLATGGAMSLGVGLSAGGRIAEGIETEIENIEEESKFLKEENGNFVFQKDANGNNIIGEDGKFVKVENPNYKPLSPNEKLAYKSAIVIGTTVLEKIGFESLGVFSKGKVANYIVGRVLKGGKKLNPLTFQRLVRREVSNLTKQGFFKFVTGVGGEITTELSQDGLDMLGKFTVNSWRAGDQFDFFDKQQFDQDTYNRWYETAAVTALATAPLAGIGGGISMIQQANLEKASAKKIATFSVFAKSPELRKAYQTQQEQLFAQNKISKKQLELNLETLSNVSGILESLPDNLSSKAQKSVLQLELEISDLKKQKTENGPASSAINEEIKNRELAIEQLVKEDQAAGGMKAELLQKKVVASQAIKNIQEQNPDGEVIVLDDSNKEEVTNKFNLDEQQKKELNESGVFIDNDNANGVILIDKDAAIDVIVHEDRHQFLSKILKDPKNEGGVFALANLIENQLNALPNNPQNLRAKQKINYLREQYEKDPKYTASMLAEELVMFFGDAIDDTSNDGMFKLDLNEGILSGVSRNIRTMFRNTFNIPVQIRNERDLIDLIKEHRKAVVDGVDSKRMQAVRAGLVTFDGDKLQKGLEIQERKEKQREQQLKEIEQDTEVVIEEEVPVPAKQSKQIKDVLDVIVQEPNGERKFQTQEEFQSDPEASFTAYNAIQNTNLLDGTINQIISSDKALSEAVSLANNPEEVRNDIIRKVKENVSLRVLKNFDPSKNESLFGYLLGKNPIINKSLLDVKKDYAKAPTSRGGNTRLQQQVEDGPQFDLVDETIDIEGDIDKQDEAVPRSTMKQALPSVVNQELEDAIETAVLEVEAGVKPDVMDKDFKSFIKEVLDEKLTPKLKKALGTGKTYEENIKKIAPKLKQMPTKFFVNLESQVKPENRVFTNPPKRLTKQADIDKAMLDDKVYVENTAQGVNSYTLKNFTTEDLLKNIFPPLTNPKTGARSGARGNKKTQVSSGLAVELGKDMIPSIFKPVTDPKVMAQVGRKIQRDPRALFKKGFSTKDVNDLILAAEASDINAAGVIAGLPKGSITVTNSNRAAKVKQVLSDIKTFGLSLNVFESSMPASAGANRVQVNKKKPNGDLTPDAKRLDAYLKKNKIKAKDGVYFYELTNGDYVKSVPVRKKDGSIGQGVTYPDGVTNLVPARGRLYYGTTDPNYIEALEAAKENTKKDALIPKKVSVIERITKAFINKFKQRSLDNMQVLEDVAFELDDAVKAGMPASTAALIIAQGYQATGGLIKISAPFTQVSTDFDYGPEGSKQGNKKKRPFIEEHNPPASTVGASLIWAIANNKTREIFPFIRKNYFQTQLSKADDFLLDMAKLDKRLPKGFSILDDSIIRLSEAGINLNKIIDPVTGKSLAENFGLGVAPSVNTMPNVVALQRQLIRDVVLGGDLKTAQQTLANYTKFPSNNNPSLAQTQNNANKNTNNTLKQSKVLDAEGDLSMGELLSKAASIDAALKNANALDKPIKKIRVFDFDDTLATSNNKVFATRGNERVEMNAEKFATDAAQMIEDGWTMDFSDFDNVTEGGRGPLFKVAQTIKEARGNEDLFVLTARGPNAEIAIYDFLKAEGLEFKRENIVGLGKSPGEAKANWIIDKAAEGYNDFYFADDAYQNVKAVQDVLSVIDIKSKVQQAKVKQSKQLSEDFNKLLEESTGVEFFKEYSPAKARTIGAGKGKFKFFIPYSAEDLTGLLYTTLTKGPKGDAQMAWYKENLLDPYARAIESLRASRINMMDDFRQLKKSLNVPKDLRKKKASGFTNEQAVRVYLWNKSGKKVPGLSNKDLKELSDAIENDPKLRLFADQLQALTKEEDYTDPSEGWLAGSITGDLIDIINKEKRSKFLAESGYTDNVNAMFSKENLNKLEALYGTKYREAMENILARMKAGRNRLETGNRLSNQVLDYINGSVGAVMFFNTRSAVLQTISAVNFMNWSFNNPIKAGKAFANQPQYWKDFTMLMNSTYLRDRRNGLRLNISESEIADAAATSKNKAKAAIAYILQKGYLPTQYADSFAIASGGATFYRNRVNDLVKQGMDQKAAEEQAMLEWQETAEISQQSSDPSKISAQQSSDLGRIILAWANTPMQYARIQKRAIQDLTNGRGDAKTNVSKIVYYGVAQNVIFNMLQQATFALGFGDDEDEMTDEELKAHEKNKSKKYFNVLNSMLDSTLRGLGIGGAAVSVAKNFLLDIYERSGRKRPEYVDSVWEFTKLSPPIYSKISKLKNAAWNFDNKKRREMMTTEGFALTNPAYEASAKVITAVTNIPLDRVLNKFNNIQGSLDEDNDMWQRIAMLGGWPEWQLKTSSQKIEDQEKIYEQEPNKYNAWEQISILKQYKLKMYELDKLKNEEDRVKKILELQKSKNKVFKPLDSDKPWEVKMKEKMKKEGKTDEEIKEAIKAKREKDKKKFKIKSPKFKKLKIQI